MLSSWYEREDDDYHGHSRRSVRAFPSMVNQTLLGPTMTKRRHLTLDVLNRSHNKVCVIAYMSNCWQYSLHQVLALLVDSASFRMPAERHISNLVACAGLPVILQRGLRAQAVHRPCTGGP